MVDKDFVRNTKLSTELQSEYSKYLKWVFRNFQDPSPENELLIKHMTFDPFILRTRKNPTALGTASRALRMTSLKYLQRSLCGRIPNSRDSSRSYAEQDVVMTQTTFCVIFNAVTLMQLSCVRASRSIPRFRTRCDANRRRAAHEFKRSRISRTKGAFPGPPVLLTKLFTLIRAGRTYRQSCKRGIGSHVGVNGLDQEFSEFCRMPS